MKNVRDGLIPVLVGDDGDRTHCPVCGMSIRMERITYNKFDFEEYVPRVFGEDVAQVLSPQDPETAEKLKELRKGKKTVAMVGLAPTSCSLAPFDDEDVEIWALNETHAFPQWFKRWDRWFQIHHTKSWQQQLAKRNVRGHYEWLRSYHYGKFESVPQPHEHWQDLKDFTKEEDGEKYVLIDFEWQLMKPIYMQYWNSEIPNSVEYPIREVSDLAFSNFRRGDRKVKYFTSTLAYMMGIALLDGFERIEIYGFELSDDIEYVKQKACAEFWIGLAIGKGIEVYVPENCQILFSTLYGGNDQGAGW
jgi:hypothetical protein